MARILVLTELLPYPLTSGAKIRAYYVLRYLAAHHQVTLLSFTRADDSPQHVAHLKTFLDSVHTVPMQRSRARDIRAVLISLATGCPAIIARERIRAMHAKLDELLTSNEFDVIHADQIPMAQYGLQDPGRKIKRVLDQHNATFQIIERLAQHEPNPIKRLLLQREARAFVRYEVNVCQRFDHVTFVTTQDRHTLLAQMPHHALEGDRTTVIPICVDVEKTPIVPPVSAPFRITHVGTMFWPPNVDGLLWFWEQVWPLVQARVPDARLTLIGKNPPEHVKALDQLASVDVLGYVQDLNPYLAETAAFIVPLHSASGMRVKILDAWCWGLPVVSTSIGAEGITVRDGEDILIADASEEFAEATIRLLQNADLQTHLRISGRQAAEEHYNWRQVYSAWDKLYAQLVTD